MENAKQITAKELKEKLDRGDNFVLVNVLSPSSFDALRIPGSINIEISQPDFLDRFQAEVPNKNQEVVVHCSSKTCQSSPAAARKLVEAGYTNITDFAGGLAEWKEAGYPMEGTMVEE